MTITPRFIFCWGLLFLFTAGMLRAQSFDSVKQVPKPERYALAERIYQEKIHHADLATAKSDVKSLQDFAVSQQDPHLELLSLMFMARVLDREDYAGKNEDTVVLCLRNALDYATRHDFKKEEAELTYGLGMKYYNIKSFPQAFEHLLEAYEKFQQVGFAEFPEMSTYLYNLGKVYYEFADYNKALRYLNEALRYPFVSERSEIHTYNTLGLTYGRLGKNDTSIYYYRKGLSVAKGTKDSVWIGILSGNMAGVFLKNNKADSAKPLILLDYTLSSKYGEWTSAANCLLLLANINMDDDSLAAAADRIRGVEQLFAKTRDQNLLRGYFSIKARLSSLQGDYRSAYMLQDSFIYYKDKISAENDQNLLRTTEIKVQTEQYLSEIQLLESDRKREQIFRNFLLSLGVFLLIISYLIINRQRLKRKKDKAILMLEKQKAEEELRNAENALQWYMNSLLEKNRMIDRFKEEVDELKSKSANMISPENEQIMDKLYQATILTEEDWTNFKRMFEKVHVDFFVRLKEKYPDLTLAEIRLIALTKLNLSVTEIANMLGISPDSVRKTGSRMRKKLNLASQTDLSEIASHI